MRIRNPFLEAGAEARWYVRGAMDPSYASEAARDRVVASLVGLGPQVPNRFRYAAAFLRGWAEHHDTGTRPILTWHRVLGRRHVVVTRGGVGS